MLEMQGYFNQHVLLPAMPSGCETWKLTTSFDWYLPLISVESRPSALLFLITKSRRCSTLPEFFNSNPSAHSVKFLSLLGSPIIISLLHSVLQLLCHLWPHQGGGASGTMPLLSRRTRACTIWFSMEWRLLPCQRPICLYSENKGDYCLWHGGVHSTNVL